MLNYAAKLGQQEQLSLLRSSSPDGVAGRPASLGSLPVAEPAYMHSFGLTEHCLVLAEFPFVVNPLALALSRRPYIENCRWKPQRGTRFMLFDRSTGALARASCATEACFAFHHVNAFDDGEQVVVDLCAYPDPGIVEDLYLERLRAGKPVGEGRAGALPARSRSAARWPANGSSRVTSSCHGSTTGAATSGPTATPGATTCGPSGWFEQIVKIDVGDGTALSFGQSPAATRESPCSWPARTPSARTTACCYRSCCDAHSETSFLLVLDASDLSELARAEVPHHIPFGFHGQFART